MKKYALILGLLLVGCQQGPTPDAITGTPTGDSTSKIASDAVIIEGGSVYSQKVDLVLVDSYSEIDRIAQGDLEYKKFLRESWSEANKVKMPSTSSIRPLSGTATCTVDVGTFSNMPINATVSGSYDSRCVSSGDATVIYGNHTITVQNTTSGASNGTSRTSTTGTISFLGAPVSMSYGYHFYCAKGYISVRDRLGFTYSGTSENICSYYQR